MLIKKLSFQTNKNLSVIQLATAEQDTVSYISGSLAIKEKKLSLKELTETGRVNHIIAINESSEFIFFKDGDLIEGAKQNRILNTSILLAPNSTTEIPVSCVEQGRWEYTSNEFSSSDLEIPTFFRASMSKNVLNNLETSKMHDSNQSEVWNAVAMHERENKYRSKTSDLAESLKKKKKITEDAIKDFSLDPNANGAAVFIGQRLLNIDIFNRKDIFAEYFPKLLKGAFSEKLRYIKESELTQDLAFKSFDQLFTSYNKIEKKEFNGAGVGTEYRFSNKKCSGFELKWEGNLIHFTLLDIGKAKQKEEDPTVFII